MLKCVYMITDKEQKSVQPLYLVGGISSIADDVLSPA